MADCLFCKMAAGEIPVRKICENEHVFVIDDINPAARVHALIITKRHFDSLPSVGDGDGAVMDGIRRGALEAARIKGVDVSGFRMIANCGADAGQTVPHLHFHILGGQFLGSKIL